MKKKLWLALVVGFLSLTAVGMMVIGEWNLDKNYSIRFSGKKVQGTFSGLTGQVSFDPNKLVRSSMDVQVNTATIRTGNSLRDKHARSKDWFDVKQYPQIAFISKSFREATEGNSAQYVVTGTLYMHGKEKEIDIPFTFNTSGATGVFEGRFQVNRKDFGIIGTKMGKTVGDIFTVQLRIPVKKPIRKKPISNDR